MNKKAFFFFTLCFVVLAPICEGQTRAIHFSIDGVALGQRISTEEIQSHFSNYEIKESSEYFGRGLVLLFNKAYFFDGIPIPINKMNFTVGNGILQGIELRTKYLDSIDNELIKQYDEAIFKQIYYQYGIHDNGPNRYPELYTSYGSKKYIYEWLGANGVTLSLWQEGEGNLKYIYLKIERNGSASNGVNRMPSILVKLNSTTL